MTNEFQAQAWICPQCFDDHGGRDCKPDDLRAEIANLRAQVERLHFDLDREARARQAAEAKVEQWRERMWATVNERAVWRHDLGEHVGELPFMPCPSCERDVHAARAESAEGSLAAVRALADEWESGPAVGYDRNEQVELDTEKQHARALRAALATPTTTEEPS